MTHVRIKNVGNSCTPKLNGVITKRVDEPFEELGAVEAVLKTVLKDGQNALEHF